MNQKTNITKVVIIDIAFDILNTYAFHMQVQIGFR